MFTINLTDLIKKTLIWVNCGRQIRARIAQDASSYHHIRSPKMSRFKEILLKTWSTKMYRKPFLKKTHNEWMSQWMNHLWLWIFTRLTARTTAVWNRCASEQSRRLLEILNRYWTNMSIMVCYWVCIRQGKTVIALRLLFSCGFWTMLSSQGSSAWQHH